MYNKLKKKINYSIDEIAPDLLSQIQSKDVKKILSEEELFCEINGDLSNGKAENKFCWRKPAAVMAVFAMCMIFIGQIISPKTYNEEIYFDINPSIKIEVQSKGKDFIAKKVKAVNPDGEEIASAVSCDNEDVDSVVEQLLFEINKSNYFDTDGTEVLITYCYENKSHHLDEVVKSSVGKFQKKNGIKFGIMYQSIDKDTEEIEAAQAKGISPGKYIYIKKIEEEYGVSAEWLYSKSIEEISKEAAEQKNKKNKEAAEETTNQNEIQTTAKNKKTDAQRNETTAAVENKPDASKIKNKKSDKREKKSNNGKNGKDNNSKNKDKNIQKKPDNGNNDNENKGKPEQIPTNGNVVNKGKKSQKK